MAMLNKGRAFLDICAWQVQITKNNGFIANAATY
jgi:hypothetical protein